MSDGSTRSRRRLSRVLIVAGVLIMLTGVLRMNARALGGPPEHPGDFGSRRTDRQVRTEVHAGCPEFVAFVATGFGVLLYGSYLGRRSAD